MSVGNFQNNLEQLRKDLRSLHYPTPLDDDALNQGHPAVFLPIIHYSLLSYSQLVAQYIVEQGFDLYMKNDHTFLENVFKLLRTNFQYRCVLSVPQFLSMGFTERKVLMCLDVIRVVRKRHEELMRFRRIAEKKNSTSPLPTDRPKTPPRPNVRTPIKKTLSVKKIDRQSEEYDVSPSYDLDSSQTSPELGSSSPTKREDDSTREGAIRQLTVAVGRLIKRVDEIDTKMEEFIEKTDAKIVLMTGKIKLLENSVRGKRSKAEEQDSLHYL